MKAVNSPPIRNHRFVLCMLKQYKTKKGLPAKTIDISCKVCAKFFVGTKNQKYCSDRCRGIGYTHAAKTFREGNPHAMRKYNKNRPSGYWKEKADKERSEVIKALGGKCCVRRCEVRNLKWLHIDYKPTMIGTGYRHPRHKSYIMSNLDKFRLLCANHHYELSITGKIEGTRITQPKRIYAKNSE